MIIYKKIEKRGCAPTTFILDNEILKELTDKQGKLTLNLLRNAWLNPKLSAWMNLFGQNDYNATPLAPPSTKMAVHIKLHKRGS